MIITGIGSRQLPVEPSGAVAAWLFDIVSEIGEVAKQNQWILRSGGAEGMDSLFEYVWGKEKEIYIPWQGFNHRYDGANGAIFIPDHSSTNAQAQKIAASVHPVWSRLKRGAKALHTRNVYQALGQYLIEPADLCIFYAPVSLTGEVMGGTRTAVEICKMHGVKTINLGVTDDVEYLREILDMWKHKDDATIRNYVRI